VVGEDPVTAFILRITGAGGRRPGVLVGGVVEDEADYE
jgi:hypothetical protein